MNITFIYIVIIDTSTESLQPPSSWKPDGNGNNQESVEDQQLAELLQVEFIAPG